LVVDAKLKTMVASSGNFLKEMEKGIYGWQENVEK
jgi:hypothetical protein